ncbi:MAG: 16S rRNA (adenine(1518)-N(6)/adenine(1519)-N(6))-dimethyltransferase RsmA [Ignavibacteriaceae bacterium]|nr:16S rRNA (adenine(1518)-N(6)/adenine(1519)-N(6))-dimethyltransferase RsmA [Ignavibacteriaceae bacterium]
MQKVKPLKRFGQNYLTDKNILNKIADEISPKEGNNLIEIGPGLGSLTEKLIERIPDGFTAVEIDTRVIHDLIFKFPTVTLIHADFLDLSLDELFNRKKEKLRIAGNIPYNITSPIIFKLLRSDNLVKDAVLMVQLEVAKRITAKKGTKDYGILAVLLQYFTDVKICFKVSRNVFHPKPNVDSAVIHLCFRDNCLSGDEKALFIKIVKAAFGKRRKVLRNSLSNSIFADVDFSNVEVNLNLRAEQLETDDFIKLTRFAAGKLQ